MAYRVLLSDADDTLFDFPAGEKVALFNTFSAMGIPHTEANLAAYHRINKAQWAMLERGETTQARLRVERMKLFLSETGYPGDPLKMSDCFVRELGQQRILLPGALDFCRRVAARMPIYLVTNGIAAIQRSRFEQSEIAPYVKGLVISEEVGVAKPDPAMVRAGLRLAGASPAEAILLGDSVTADIPAARSAGVDSILFTNGRAAPANHGAVFTARTLDEAADILLR